MSAADDFPRGPTLGSVQIANGAAANVTFPAMPGIAWVLTAINATLQAFAGYAGGLTTPQIIVNPTLEINGVLITAVTNPGDNGTVSWQGKVQAPIDTAVGISWNTFTVAGLVQTLYVDAYPIPAMVAV